MKLTILHCSICKTPMSDAAWRSIFGSADAINFFDGYEPTYQCGCNETAGPRVFFVATFAKEQLEASHDRLKAFVFAKDIE